MPACEGTELAGLEITLPAQLGVISGINVLYSIVPWAAALALVVTAAYRRRTSLIVSVVLLLAMIVLNEAVLKNILKQPRPAKSCLTSSGMPSSHSVLSLGFVVFIGLEMFFHQWHITRLNKLQVFMGSVFLLVPVPASRIGLNDHTPFQVGVGVLVGTIIAAGFFALLHFVIGAKLEAWTQHPLAVKLGLINDYVVGDDDEALLQAVRTRGEKYLVRQGSAASPPAPPRPGDQPPPLTSFKAFAIENEDGDEHQHGGPAALDALDGVDDDDLLAHPDDSSDEEQKMKQPKSSHQQTKAAAELEEVPAATRTAAPPQGTPQDVPFPTGDDSDSVMFTRSDDD